MKLSILIPVYNEEDTILETLERVRCVDIDKEIIVVDDSSTDGSRGVLEKQKDIKLILHESNMGKGMALRTALKEVTGDIVIIQDADLEYYPDDFHVLIKPIVDGDAEVVYGSRFLEGRPEMPFPNFVANRLLAVAANVLFNAHITDEATCYKAFKADLIKNMSLTCRRFEFCPEVTAKVRRKNIEIVEVPVKYTARTCAQGKKIGWQDGFIAIWTLLKFRFIS